MIKEIVLFNVKTTMRTLNNLLASTLTLYCVVLSIVQVQASAAKVKHINSINHANQNQESSTNRSITKSVVENYRLDNYENSYEVNADYTYTQTISSQTTLLTRSGIENNQNDSQTYYPDSQSLDLLEAYVIQPDGTKIEVAKENVMTETSGQLQNKTDSNKSVKMSVVFPKLTVGSQIFVKWKITQKKPPVISFYGYDTPLFDEPTINNTVRISLPAKLKLRWQQRGGYKVTDEIKGNRRIITANIKNQSGRQREDSMVNSIDISPLFIFTNLDSWEQIGAIYSKQSRDKILVTPEIETLANKITGNKQGIEAARAIYNWVAQNIQYVAIYLNESAGYVPNSSSDVLRNGYGDCKDHVVLMQALLKAKNIDAQAVLVDWGHIYEKLPLPVPIQFNHVMIYLPAYNIFANPTAHDASFGELDTSLSGKFVIIADNKSQIAYTPKTTTEQNRYTVTNTIQISADGSIDGEALMKSSGDINGRMRSYFDTDTSEKMANQLLSSTTEGGTGWIEKSDLNNLDKPVQIKAKWNSPLAVNVGKQIYLTTPAGISYYNPQSLRSYLIPGKRQYPLVIGASSTSWEYKIVSPPNYKVSHLPENITFSNSAGEYKSSYKVENNFIIVKRNLVIKQNIYSPEEYGAFKELIEKPITDVRNVMVLDKS